MPAMVRSEKEAPQSPPQAQAGLTRRLTGGIDSRLSFSRIFLVSRRGRVMPAMVFLDWRKRLRSHTPIRWSGKVKTSLSSSKPVSSKVVAGVTCHSKCNTTSEFKFPNKTLDLLYRVNIRPPIWMMEPGWRLFGVCCTKDISAEVPDRRLQFQVHS